MGLLIDLLRVIVRPLYAAFLALGAIAGTAAAVVIMNLLVGYFAVASEAYINVHPHVVIHGSWPVAEAHALASRLQKSDPLVAMAAPAVHFDRTITLAAAAVLTNLCDTSQPPENRCSGSRDIARATRTYAYEVRGTKEVNVQIRGISIVNGDTVANYRRVIAAQTDLGALARDRDTGGNALPISFLAQDTLLDEVSGNYLMSPGALAPTYPRYFRLTGVIRLGARSTGDPLLILGLAQALTLAPAGLTQPNAIELRLAQPLAAEQVAARLRATLGGDLRVETWIDKERPAFDFLNATWMMVFTVMLSICLVVGISIYSTLTLSVLRNRWKLALLGCLGCTPLRIGMVFIAFALGVAATGIGGGVILGEYLSEVVGGALYRSILGLPPERFAATMTFEPAAWMSAATLGILIAAALMPARRAVSIEPSQALRGIM